MANKYVYLFSEGDGNMKELLGGKGANLAEMTKIGLPVPQGFTISTEACTRYYSDGESIGEDIEQQIFTALKESEKINGKKFGDPANPFLVSVRSGSRASMPGMMDTILNLGLNDETVLGLSKLTNNERFAFDSYRRFIQMYSDVVMELEKTKFEELIDELKHAKGVKLDTELTAEDLKELVKRYKKLYKDNLKEEFPQDPVVQLMGAIKAVFRSWNNNRAVVYRRLNDIPATWGTAVNVQAMVFGNMGNDCGTGVAFTRNPANGEKKLFGEYLINAQGEDVVAGIRTPQDISKMQEELPEIYKQFVEITQLLEKHYKEMQDVEFTVERGKLYMLQTRNGKRTAKAALKISVDLFNEGMIDEKEALLRIDPKQLDALLHPQFDEKALKAATVIGKGLAASPGAAVGKIAFTAEKATLLAKNGDKVILVRQETSPEDIEGMAISQGILTARGGMTSHAAVVARGMGTACVAGCHELIIDEKNHTLKISDRVYKEGDVISLDGGTGYIYDGAITKRDVELTGDFGTVMAWADKHRALKIRTNADSPKDTLTALRFGAQGIGLVRTEHMFFEADRIPAVREMIVSKTLAERERALAKLLPMQKKDFKGIFEALNGLPATIRLLDPPLHEFLPHTDEEIKSLASEMGITFAELKQAVDGLHEFNPMMGHRGCRLSVSYPEIAVMQTRAIIEAAIEVKTQKGIDVVPEIMIPLICDDNELVFVKNIIVEAAEKLIKESKVQLKYSVGTMIEIPRACVLADKIAVNAEFFSFGTNDLTQMTYGFSRDDAGKFLEDYYSKKVFEQDPFARLDQNGVGELIKMAVERGRSTRKDLKIGICGEHGGDPSSIDFCHRAGLDYVSCSPFRVPIARLAAAQANIRNPRK